MSAGKAPSASIERQDGEHAGTVVVPAQSATTRRPHIEATPCQSPQRSTVVETANTTSASYIGQSSLQQKTMTTQTEWDIWGSPISGTSNTLSARSERDVGVSERIQEEWKKYEKKAEAREEQFNA